MTIALRVAGAAKDITGLGLRRDGALKEITEAWLRVGGALKQVYGKLAAALSKSLVLGRGNSASVIIVVSESVTVTTTGTIGAVSHAWGRTDSGVQPWTITDPSSATTAFSTQCDQGEAFTATFVCTVTDRAGQVLVSDPVTADCANIYYGGGYVGDPSLPPGTVYP